MSRITQQQLESYLWGAATLLRGTIDAGDYKQFIFPLLFYKRLCDVFDEETLKALRESGGDEAFAQFPENHRFQIPPEAHWREVRKATRDVGRVLQQSMRAIETANQNKLYNIFGDAQWTNKDRLSDSMLRDLVEHFSTLELTVANLPEDELGQGYEYLIKKFADDSGHTAAEFYTNRTVVHLMTEMLDVQPGESVYDPTCGSGGMLLSCISHLRNQKKEWRNVKLFGQERNLMTSSIARMNCFLHGIEDFRIERGDTLAEPKLVEGDRLMKFDVVLANPPYSIKQWNREAFAADPWGRNLFGVPPQGRADYAFQQHILESLKPKTGRSAVLWPHGVLFRQEEAEMRRKLIEADLIECVIGLGPNLFYNSAMDSCVVVCRASKPKNRRGKILLIDAKNEVIRDRTQSFLTPEHLARIINTYRDFKEEPLFSRVVSLSEARANEGNLNIALYIDSTPKSGVSAFNDRGDLEVVFRSYTESAARLRTSLAKVVSVDGRVVQKLEDGSNKISLPKWIDKSKWKRVRLGEVAVRDAGKIEPDGTTVHRWVAADHIDEGDIHVRRWSDTNDPLFPPTFRFTFKAGNVLLHSRNPKKVVIPRFDGITGEKLFVLKARTNEVLREDFLAFVLISSYFGDWVSQWMSGSVNKFLNWSAFEKFEFHLPPLDQQRRIAEILWAVDESARKATTMVEAADATELIVLKKSFEPMAKAGEWAKCTLAEVGELKIGQQKSPKFTKGLCPRPYLKVGNISDGRVKVSNLEEMDFDQTALAKYRLLTGDLLLTEGDLVSAANVGRSAMFRGEIEDCGYQNHLIRLRCHRHVLPEFGLQLLRFLFHNGVFARAAKKTTVVSLGVSRVSAVEVAIPPKTIQAMIAEKASQMERLRLEAATHVERTRALGMNLVNAIL